MIYKKSNKSFEATKIVVNDELCIVSTGNYLNKISPSKSLILLNDDEIRSLEITRSNDLIVNQNKIIFRDKVKSFKKGTEFVSNINSNEFFLVKKINFDQAKVNFNLYDKNESSLISLNIDNINPKFIYKNLVISLFQSKITVFDFKLQRKIWSKKTNDLLLSQSTKIYGNPLLIENKLCLFLYDSTRSTNLRSFLIVNVENGTLIFETKEFGGWLTNFNSNIYSVFDKQIHILDTKSFQIDKIDLSDSLNQLDRKISIDGDPKSYTKTFFLSNNLYSINQDYFYFSEDKGSMIGIINLSTKKLEWSTALGNENNENSYIKDFKISQNTIYVLDGNSTLHIFEKTKFQRDPQPTER